MSIAPSDTSAPRGQRHSYRTWLMLIVLAGLAFRAAVIIYADRRPTLFDFPDSRRYATVARNVAAGLGPIDSAEVRAGTDPVYPALLSLGALAGLHGDDQLFRWGRLINCMFSAASIFLVVEIGRRVRSEVVGLAAGAFFALDPITVFFNALVLTETCYTTMLLGAVLLMLDWRRAGIGRFWLPAFSGALLGLATLTRSSSLFLPAIFAPLIALGECKGRRLVASGIFLAASIGMLVPTLIRNHRLFGAIVPVRTGSGASLMEALGPWADGGPGMDRIHYPRFMPGANEYERDQVCRAAALDWARHNPTKAASLAFAKVRRTWSITMNATSYSSKFYAVVSGLTVAPIFALALIGLWRGRAWDYSLAILLAPVAYFTLVHMVFVGSVRYRMPAVPVVFILAAVGLDAILRRSMSPPKSSILGPLPGG